MGVRAHVRTSGSVAVATDKSEQVFERRCVGFAGRAPYGKLAIVTFTFVDLFAGIGGFHAALGAAGGECWFASEIDQLAASVYERNWGLKPHGDIVPLTEDVMAVPPHDVLAAGFPCQPFSKSGFQRGMEETRGTLFFNICMILKERRPPVIVLENVRNLAGPRQRDTWETIVRSLRDLGYRVSDEPAVFSPHLLPLEMGGRPQVRERVFITGTYVGRERAWAETDWSSAVAPKLVGVDVEPIVTSRTVFDWDRPVWDIEGDLPLQPDGDILDLGRYGLNDTERGWINMWNHWIGEVSDAKLPGFPIWADAFRYPAEIPDGTPDWKANFLTKNAALYLRNNGGKARSRSYKGPIDKWLDHYNRLEGVPLSRRKLEWQAQDAERDLWQCVLHMRPSGIRAKRPTYLPALVAITQTSIYGPRRRRITPLEAARLQGLPDWFDFGGQPEAATYRQLGNGVNVGAAYYVFRQHVLRDAEELRQTAPHLLDAVLQAGPAPVIEQGTGSRTIDLTLGNTKPRARKTAVVRDKQVRVKKNAEGLLVDR